MQKLLLLTPPFVQVNCPYPATAYLQGYLRRQGFDVVQEDLSIELIHNLFCRDFLEELFEIASECQFEEEDENLLRITTLRAHYLRTIDSVMSFLSGADPSLASLICTGDFLPQGARFDSAEELDYYFGTLGSQDCAKYLCTLYLQDISDLIRAVVSEHFEIVRYGEQIAVAIDLFSKIEQELLEPRNLIEERMVELLEQMIAEHQPTHIGFSIPFPGNLLSTLRCGQYLKEQHPEIQIIAGGGYPTTELRQLTDKKIFHYIDYIVLDDGEEPLRRILAGEPLLRTYTASGYEAGEELTPVSHRERGCPDYQGLPHNSYLSLTEVTNPMHRLWSDGRWNKMTLAHGCYWAKCAFCDTSLDYICRYDHVSASELVDWMEQIMEQTGSRGFHFTDEAAPPTLLRELSLEILRRGLVVSWWTNVRFESGFTGDLTQLMSAAGCIAISGGLEVASDRLLGVMNKGVTIEQATIAMRNFFYAGIMVHTYLMYGFPTETLQESIDSLEVVRQLFRAELINSAFWHRYAMTLHSPSGRDPEAYGVKRRNAHVHTFANNEVAFVENRTYNIHQVGEGLREALANYLYGQEIDTPVHLWFPGKNTPKTTVEDTLITDQLIKPDRCRIFNEQARLVWIGAPATRHSDGLLLHNRSEQRVIHLKDFEAEFMLEITALCSNLSKKVTFAEVAERYKAYSSEPFSGFYHGKKWDQMRLYGLLQI